MKQVGKSAKVVKDILLLSRKKFQEHTILCVAWSIISVPETIVPD